MVYSIERTKSNMTLCVTPLTVVTGRSPKTSNNRNYDIFVLFMVTAFNGRCEYGWTFYGASCYRSYTYRQSFADAQASCEAVEAALASISSSEENQAISSKYCTFRVISFNIVNRFAKPRGHVSMKLWHTGLLRSIDILCFFFFFFFFLYVALGY